jgi:hypothetical protein
VGRWKRVEECLAAKLLEELRACAGYIDRTSVIARDLYVLRSLAFSTVRELTRSLYVPAGGRPYLGLSDQFCPCPPFRIARDQLLELTSVGIGKALALGPP